MFRRQALALMACATLGAAALSSAALSDAETKPFGIGDKIDPTITLKDLNGKAWKLGDFQKTDEREGQIVVLDFWSIQCPVSIRYEERMKKFHTEMAKKNIVFLAIDSNHTEVDDDAEDPLGRIKKYVKKAEVKFPVLIDRGNRIADRFGAKTTPHLYIIDQEGVLQYMGALDNDSRMKKEKNGEEIETYGADAVASLLKGEKPAVQSTPPVGCTIKRVKAAAQ